MKKTSKTRDAGGEELWSSILTSFMDTATRSNGFKVIRTRARPISARVASMGDLLCLFTGAPPSGRGLTGNDTEIGSIWDLSILMGHRCMRILLRWLLCDGIICGPLHAVDGSPLYEDPAEVQSTDWPCALDICNTARIFTHESNTCVIRRWAFLILGCIDLLSCNPPPTTLLWPSLGGAQGLSTAPARRRSEKVAQGRSVLIHCNQFERTTDLVRQRPPWLCLCTIQAAQRIFLWFWVSERLQSKNLLNNTKTIFFSLRLAGLVVGAFDEK